jgi:hypothetical protein
MSTMSDILIGMEESVARTHGTRAASRIISRILRGETHGEFTVGGHVYQWQLTETMLVVTPKEYV